MLTVTTVCTGAEFDDGYVRKLKASVARNLKADHRFIALADRDIEGVEVRNIAELGLPGWWGKLALFAPDILPGQKLFFDLDTVITGSLDFIVDALLDEDHNSVHEFVALRGAYQRFRLGSGVMYMSWGFGEHVWTPFAEAPEWAMQYCGDLGDGHWIQLCLGERPRFQDLFPGKFASFKAQCPFGRPPIDASVVFFHGLPRPHEVADLPFMKQHWRE